MRLILQPGARLVVRRPGQVTVVGSGPALVGVTLPDGPAVRRLLGDLATGRPPVVPDSATHRALSRLSAAGLTESADGLHARRAARTAARVLVDAPPGLGSAAVELLMASGVAVTTRDGAATHALVAATGEVERARLDGWVRRGVSHLVLVDRLRSVTVGPYVVPGRTACVHCLDAHRAEVDPDYGALVAGLAEATPPGPATPGESDAALRAAATAWAVRDLVSAVEGDRPSTWSATVTLHCDPSTGLRSDRREWRRHIACGCTWADELAG